MPKPKRIQRLTDMGAKALQEYEEASSRRERWELDHAVDDLRRVADRQGWSITEKEEKRPEDELCADCGISTEDEYYVVNDRVWTAAGMDPDGLLCIGCIECRLGRELRAGDFADVPANAWALLPEPLFPGSSERLRDRLTRGLDAEGRAVMLARVKKEAMRIIKEEGTMNEPNEELTELPELVKQDVDSYTWAVGTGPPATEDRWGNPIRENGQPVAEQFPDDSSWVWADSPVEGFMPRTNAKDLIGPTLMAHPMRLRIAEMLNAGDVTARVLLGDPEAKAETDADPAVQFYVESGDELILLLRLPATELGWRLPDDPFEP